MDIQVNRNTSLRFSDNEQKSFNRKLDILMIEDMDSDAQLVEHELIVAGFSYSIRRVDNKDDFLYELYNTVPDIILADYSLPQFSGLEALMLLKKFNADVPFILVTGTQSEEVAVECMKEGADDYVLKSSLKRLPPAVRNALKNRDIRRERNNIEAALRRSEEHYRLITENTKDLICMLDIEGNFLYLSPSYKEVLGYKQQDLLGVNAFSLIHPDDKNFIFGTWEASIQDRKGRRVEYRSRHRDGRWKFFEANANWIFNDSGLPFKAVVVSRDVTDRKTMEENLRKERDYISQIIEGTPALVCGILPNGITTFVNPSVEKVTGYDEHEVIGVNWWNLFYPGEEYIQVEKLFESFKEGQIRDYEMTLTTKSGEKRIIAWNSLNQFDDNGNISEIIGFGNDITLRKKAEKALGKTSEQLRNIFNNLDIVFFSYDVTNNKLLQISPACQKVYGISQQEFIERPSLWMELHHSKDSQFTLISSSHSFKEYKYRIVRPDGQVKWLEVKLRDILTKDNNVKRIDGMVTDVTERKNNEEKIHLLANAVESTHEFISITDLDHKFTFVNNAFLKGYGYTYSEVIGKTPLMLDSENNPPDLRSRLIEKSRNGGWRGELLNKTKNGEEFPIYLTTNEIRNEQDEIIGHIGVARDITEPKKTEEKLKNSLKEKEIILKEIHHRVKNNLQVISSIFYLQSEKVNDKRFHEIINECKNRVRSMAIIHENLYQSDDLTRIDFSQYLSNLINNLVISYGVDPGRIDIEIDVKDMLLSIDAAIPCGLLINEVISNSIKHAFPGGRSGNILIQMYSNNYKDYILRIKDNGIGFPHSLDFKHTNTLGMELITTLTQQLEGSIELNSSDGTEFIIKFAV